MRNIFCVLMMLTAISFTSIFGGCGGGGGDGDDPSVSTSTSTISGSAVKGPVEDATVHVYYFDEEGNEVEIPTADGPVYTDAAGAFSFPLDGSNLMGITSPLIVRTVGGTMYGGDAPTLEAVIADPQPLTFARVTISCPLSAASSVAVGLLRKITQSQGSAPTLDDAEWIIALVEDQLKVDLNEDPSDSRTNTGMLNESIDKNLDLLNTSSNNAAVSDFISYLVANLDSSSGLLDDFMDDPGNPGTDTPASFDPFAELVSVIGDPADFILMTLTSDVTYLENDWTDTANITATLMDAAGRPYQGLDAVQLGLVSGPGFLLSAGLSYARGEVRGELTSDTTGDTGDILIRAICSLSNGNDISLEILVKALDFYVDNDGDGLTDGDEELERTIFVDVAGFGLETFSDKLMKYDDVTSDPTLSDTDGDGLDDHTEYILKTHPRMADTDGDGLTDAEEVNRWQTNPLTVDTDFDAGGLDSRSPHPELFDYSELVIYKTSPSLQDTDGDGRTEFEEIFLLNRNPLVSDLPKLEMEIADAVDVRLDVTYAEDVGETRQYGTEMMKSATRSDSTYNEKSMELSIEQEVNFGVFSWGSTTFKAGYGQKWSTTQESSNTSQETYSEYTTDSRTRTETAASGSMTAGIRLRNPSAIAYKLSKLGIAVRHCEQVWDEDQQQVVKSFKTIATLVLPLGDGITMAPGEETPVLQVEATDLNPDRVKELLKRPESLYLEDEYFDMENAVGLNYDFLREINITRTAGIIIDPGQNNAQEYRVATNVQRGADGAYSGITIGEILSDILNVDFATIGRRSIYENSPTNEQVLFRIGAIETNLTDPELGYWMVTLKSENPPSGLYDFEEIPVKAGDRVLVVYVGDEDNDSVNDLLEQHCGTHDGEDKFIGDYDGDTLSDEDEFFGGWRVAWTNFTGEQHEYDVVSDPKNADQDADGLDDSQEKGAGTDPCNPDTDRDGIIDSEDPWPLYQAKLLYVDQNATGVKDGSSWKDAYTDLQNALAAARTGYDSDTIDDDDVSEIWVADGTYTPHESDVNAYFPLVGTVGVYGGFRGIEENFSGETKRSQREQNPRVNGTILSGELGDPALISDNSHIVVGQYGPGIILDGFLITGAYSGSGMFTDAGPVILRNLFFEDNQGGQSLSVFGSGGGVQIIDCIFSGNTGYLASVNPVVKLETSSTVMIDGCRFIRNKPGAIFFQGYNLTIKNTDFQYNDAAMIAFSFGGAILIQEHSSHETNVIIDNCRFIGNQADGWGGAISVGMYTNIQITNSLFWQNETKYVSTNSFLPDGGGGIFAWQQARLSVVNCTFAENKTGGGVGCCGGGICMMSVGEGYDYGSLIIENSIFWGNLNGTSHDALAQVGIAPDYWSNRLINTSCIEGLEPIHLEPQYGLDCIWQNPQFNETSGTLALDSGSPCIDTGNTYVDANPLTPGYEPLPETDLAGAPRIVDGDDDGVTEVDMGAYEYQP